MKDWRLKNHDWILTAVTFMLTFIGLVVIYSATFNAQTEIEGVGTVNRQLVFVMVGFIIYFLVSRIDPTFYKYIPIQAIIIGMTVGLLFYVWHFGDPVRNTNRWIEWGFVRIQPSEYAKIALILLNSAIIADVLTFQDKEEVNWSTRRGTFGGMKKMVFSAKHFTVLHPTLYRYGMGILLTALCIGLILVEPALGNASITTLICASLYIFGFPKQKYMLGLGAIGLLSANLLARVITFQPLYNLLGVSLVLEGFDVGLFFVSIIICLLLIIFLKLKILPVMLAVFVGIGLVLGASFAWNNVVKDYQKQRVEVFLNPEKDPQGAAWQLRQSRIAIGSGRLFGKGFLHGSQSKLRYLPEAYTDFIFAAFCEEFGLVGASFLLFLFGLLFTRIIRAARNASSYFKTLICVGVVVMLFVHVVINTGMNMGIMPITGIPLPLISYGGSSIMVTMIALGLVQAVNTYKDVTDMKGDMPLMSRTPWRE